MKILKTMIIMKIFIIIINMKIIKNKKIVIDSLKKFNIKIIMFLFIFVII